MLKVVGEEPLLLVECALHIRRRGRLVFLEPRGVNEPHLPAARRTRSTRPGNLVERLRRLLRGVERPGAPAALEILHAFPKRCVHAAVNEPLRRHDDSALLFLDLEEVAGFEPETVVQLLGDHDLTAHAQLDGSPCFGSCFHIFVYCNWREPRSTVCLIEDPPDEGGSTLRRQLGIFMDVHSGLHPGNGWRCTLSFLGRARVGNLLKDHT